MDHLFKGPKSYTICSFTWLYVPICFLTNGTYSTWLYVLNLLFIKGSYSKKEAFVE